MPSNIAETVSLIVVHVRDIPNLPNRSIPQRIKAGTFSLFAVPQVSVNQAASQYLPSITHTEAFASEDLKTIEDRCAGAARRACLNQRAGCGRTLGDSCFAHLG